MSLEFIYKFNYFLFVQLFICYVEIYVCKYFDVNNVIFDLCDIYEFFC